MTSDSLFGVHVLPTHLAMLEFGADLAEKVKSGDVVLLHGDLGAGKTTLVQGMASALGVSEPIQSPTFGLVAEHKGKLVDGSEVMIHHLDLYRLESPEELEDLGYDRFIAPLAGISLIEWPERAQDWLPDRFMLVRIRLGVDGGRVVEVTAHEGTSGTTTS